MSPTAKGSDLDSRLEALLTMEMSPPPDDAPPELAEQIIRSVRAQGAQVAPRERSHPVPAALTAAAMGATLWAMIRLTADSVRLLPDWGRWAALLQQKAATSSGIWLPALMWVLAAAAIYIALQPEEIERA